VKKQVPTKKKGKEEIFKERPHVAREVR